MAATGTGGTAKGFASSIRVRPFVSSKQPRRKEPALPGAGGSRAGRESSGKCCG